ncbi:hypothetical protein N7530_008728 [Penicillium desertorum]|uniref:Uncharacterized protein n=1 Tax=Penicillium desertorum TaxID=1303715 RepID=A0A9W9WPY9_9EURO|nr:hypothetical protein N7530_008728 [Penicillium desertorum]
MALCTFSSSFHDIQTPFKEFLETLTCVFLPTPPLNALGPTATGEYGVQKDKQVEEVWMVAA